MSLPVSISKSGPPLKGTEGQPLKVDTRQLEVARMATLGIQVRSTKEPKRPDTHKGPAQYGISEYGIVEYGVV